MPKIEELEEKDNKIVEEKIADDVAPVEKKADKAKKTVKKKETQAPEKKKTEEKATVSDKKVIEKSSEKEVKNPVDEATVIEKIKSFIAKIAAMQEEARKEALEESEEKTSEKTEKVKVKADKKQVKDEPKKIEYMLEYYDLPYRYNETVVKILAQTPKRMFVYWDISDNDRQKYINTFGNDFFDKTYPVLLLYNEDKKYVREITINDFANSWYIDIEDPKTKYTIQLGRKFKDYSVALAVNHQKIAENNIIVQTDYLPFANSNVLEVPNDHVLLETLPDYITFRNVKTNQETVKAIKAFRDSYGMNYDVKEFYEEQYKDEISEGMFDMANPSSKLTSSSFK